MKKRLLILKSLALVACLSSALGASAYRFVADGIYYNVKSWSDKTLEVTYKDTNYDCYSGNLTIPSVVTYYGEPYTVTAIGNRAFYNCEMTNVVLPSTLVTIGDEAFGGISDYLTCLAFTPPEVGNDAFGGDTYSTCLLHVPHYAREDYRWCEGWENFTQTNLDPETGEGEDLHYDFYVEDVYYLIVGNAEVEVTNEDIEIDQGEIGGEDYGVDCYMGNVGIPDTLTFRGTTFKVVRIGSHAFENCSGLANVSMPNTITDINWNAFRGCSGMGNVTIPASVTFLDEYLFWGCDLKCVTCLATTPPETYDDGPFRYSGADEAPMFVPRESQSDYLNDPYWGQFDIKPSLDYAANVTGGTIEFNSTGVYSWTNVVEGDRTYVRSGNLQVNSSTSTMTATVTVDQASKLSFDFKVMGERPNCDFGSFSIDGTERFSYDELSSDWWTYSIDLDPGTHTLTWTYSKDMSVHPDGDYFAIDNVKLAVLVQRGDVNGDGSVNTADVSALINLLLTGGTSIDGADANQDGFVNTSDVAALINYLLTSEW